MPEGDTIWRAARTLGGALAGREVTAFSSPLPRVAEAARRWGVVGSRVDAVDAVGKHLLLRFSTGAVLRTHQRMTGSWHLYRPQSAWRKPAHRARAVVATDAAVAVCFDTPVVELLSPSDAAAESGTAHLGPDPLAESFDRAAALSRLRARADDEIGVALLDQTALAGIGNVYKSEVLFIRGVDPFAPVSALDDATLAALIDVAQRQMRRNLSTDLRRTTPDLSPTRFWAYGRAAQPCRRCRTPIRRRTQGPQARSTYWCPRCQPSRPATPAQA
jgi:endonuclease-8